MNEVTTYPERVLVALNPDGSIRGVSVDQITAVDGVAVKTNQIPAETITDRTVTAILDALSVNVGNEVIALRPQIEALTTERDTLQIEADKVSALTTERDTLTIERDDLLTRVPKEKGPREVSPEEFAARFTEDETYAIGISDLRAAVFSRMRLTTRIDPIDLDSPITTKLVAALVTAGLVTQDRADAILGVE